MNLAVANPQTRRGGDRTSRSPIRVAEVGVPVDRERRRSVVLPGVAFAAGVLLLWFLLQFAVELLPWVLGLVLFALVLHAFVGWLAHSDLLSAPWLFIIALAVAAAVWIFWPGSSFQQGLDPAQFLPASVVRALN